MPTRPLTPCNRPGCSQLVPSGTAYCEKHKRQERKRYANTPERKESNRFYSSKRWLKLRAMFLRSHVLCERCGDVATICHHCKVSVKDDPSRAMEWDNLEALCNRCHEAAHPDRWGGRK
jgi:5-methylcytosine-specific restriction enzyme A